MKVGFTCSSWDLLHAGHIILLREAKENCDYLIVGIHVDPSLERPEKNKPIESLEERIIKVDSIKYVDKFFTYETEEELLKYLTAKEKLIDVRFLGSDYLGKDFTGRDLDIDIYYHHRDHNYSSSDLRHRIITDYENAKYDIVRDTITRMSRSKYIE